MHGDLSDVKSGGRLETCGCGACVDTRRFEDLRDLAEPPPRPAAINTRLEAAQFLKWIAYELVTRVDAAKEGD
jgi:hypothetical protein